ncbi:hypothetical protein DL768_005681 [Monosporascus sp. mg162]|nr:hypothetical protein DL768_005681 [Monosporascus sp. mg162]
MEDRKRPALSSSDDIAPPSKRQAVNGGSKSKEEGDEAWIEDYQKDAIYRQMLEYKREKGTLEARLDEYARRATHHDDHLRIVDAWWLQLLQEIELMAKSRISSQADQSFPTHTHFRGIEDFESHLGDKAAAIKQKIEEIFSRLSGSRGQVSPNISDLEAQVNALLAKQKDFLVKIDRLTSDKDNLSTQLDTATLRYMKAERKLDRLKSAQVQKLEQQAIAQATSRPGASDQQNGMGIDGPSGGSEALQSALQEATAVAEKRKEQLEAALNETKSLQEQLSTIQARQTSLSDEEYSRTEVFRLFKAQNEELTKRVNHLEAANKSLQSMNEQLKKEREASRQQLETEAQALIADLEDQLQQADTNLARIRATRDELLAEVTMLKAGKEQERTAIEHMKELLSAKEDRISTLESEVERLKPSEDADMTARPEIDELSPDELREKCKKLMRDYESIESELPGLTKTIKRYKELANNKVMDFATLEERVALAIAEKGKADQKYFNTRKDADQKGEEIKKLRMQNNKSSEIISQLKDVEAQNRTLVTNLDKQLADMKQTNAALMAENKRLDVSSGEALRRFDTLKQQVTELTGLVKSKDSTTAMARERTTNLEVDVEKLKVRLDSTSKDRDKWKAKSLSNSSEEEEMLRKLATCSICRTNFKDTDNVDQPLEFLDATTDAEMQGDLSAELRAFVIGQDERDELVMNSEDGRTRRRS